MPSPVHFDFVTAWPCMEAEVVEYCQSSDRVQLFQGGSTRVVLLNDDTIVKFSGGVYAEEFENQKFVNRYLADHASIFVPHAHHYFRRNGTGYLIMERVKDLQELDLDNNSDITAVAQALLLIHSLVRSDGEEICPGPVNGGTCRILFRNDVCFKSKDEFKQLIDDRLIHRDLSFNLQDQDFAFVHLDITLQNFCRTPNGQICILDWEMAGFYPRWMEHAVLEAYTHAQSSNNIFKHRVVEALQVLVPLNDNDARQKRFMKQVLWNCISTSLWVIRLWLW